MSTVEAMASSAVPPSRTGTRSRMFSWALAAGLTQVPTGRVRRDIPSVCLQRPGTRRRGAATRRALRALHPGPVGVVTQALDRHELLRPAALADEHLLVARLHPEHVAHDPAREVPESHLLSLLA